MISFAVGEQLSIADDERRKKQLHILDAHLSDGTALSLSSKSRGRVVSALFSIERQRWARSFR